MALDPVTGLPQAVTPAVAAPTTPTAPTQPGQPTVNPLPVYTAPTYTPGSNFTWDPNTVMPGIQQNANAIYNPQIAQIQALATLGQQQADQAKITTQQQFDKQLAAEIEAINQRGAFFGGGAITDQNQMQQANTNALNAITQKNQADQAGFLAQEAGLSAQQAQYITDQLNGAKDSAYSMWNDAYNRFWDQTKFDYQKQQDAITNQQNQDRIDDAKYGAGYSSSDNKTQAKMRAKYNKRKK